MLPSHIHQIRGNQEKGGKKAGNKDKKETGNKDKKELLEEKMLTQGISGVRIIRVYSSEQK